MDRIFQLLYSLGIYSHYKGYRYLASAVALILLDESLTLKEMQRCITQSDQVPAVQVEQNLRTVVNACWDKGNRELLIKLSKRDLEERPSVLEFLDILATHLLRED